MYSHMFTKFITKFHILIADTIPPIIVCPANITQTSLDSNPVFIPQPDPVTVTDNSGSVTWESDWPVDGVFGIGETHVIYTAVDPSGNIAICEVTVTINAGMF